ncbi:MAG: hypothetical protein WCB17_07565, partial [Dehalococcoidales bacterium]
KIQGKRSLSSFNTPTVRSWEVYFHQTGPNLQAIIFVHHEIENFLKRRFYDYLFNDYSHSSFLSV